MLYREAMANKSKQPVQNVKHTTVYTQSLSQDIYVWRHGYENKIFHVDGFSGQLQHKATDLNGLSPSMYL